MRKITNLYNQITVNSKIRFGKPCIKGTRIAVEDVLNLFKAGYNFQEILKEYPHIKKEDIIACLEYTSSILSKEELYSIAPIR